MEGERTIGKKMAFQKFLLKLAGRACVFAVNSWMGTLDYRILYYDDAIDPASPECSGQKIYIFWHEYILFPFYLRGNCYLTMLLSRHRDANILSEAATRMGYEFVRGSTNRGGERAIRALAEAAASRHLTITPDGPRGPRRQMAPGAVYLASRLNMPIVAMGFGYNRPWRLGSWDHFAIPRPFSRARAIMSEEIWIPRDLDKQGIEKYRGLVEERLNELTLAAEVWATSGESKPGERPLFKAAASHPPSAEAQEVGSSAMSQHCPSFVGDTELSGADPGCLRRAG